VSVSNGWCLWALVLPRQGLRQRWVLVKGCERLWAFVMVMGASGMGLGCCCLLLMVVFMLKYSRNHNLFLLCVILSRGRY
jgi:hypothetical protein